MRCCRSALVTTAIALLPASAAGQHRPPTFEPAPRPALHAEGAPRSRPAGTDAGSFRHLPGVWLSASGGSVVGLLAGASIGLGLCGSAYRCGGEDPGLGPMILGMALGSTLGSAGGATLGARAEGARVPFGHALAGGLFGIWTGLVSGYLVGRATDATRAQVLGFALGQGGAAALIGLAGL